jgi:hypothetical protein
MGMHQSGISPHGSGERALRHAIACALVRYRHEHHGVKPDRVCSGMFAALLSFARELTLAIRRSGTSRRSAPRTLDPWNPRTKCVVMKWFRRGVSGRLLWLLAESIKAGKGGEV